jgi:hypothetical protein
MPVAVPYENEARCDPVTELSARDLSCSDQLNAPWSGRDCVMLDVDLNCGPALACACPPEKEDRRVDDANTPDTETGASREFACTLLLLLTVVCGVFDGTTGLALPVPGLVPPVRYPLGFAPKDMRRVKGVVGTVRELVE